jgi:hypothetical protein
MSAEAAAASADNIKGELMAFARKGGALAAGVADAEAFTAAPEGHRPTDLLPGAKSVLVVGGAQPRAADWQSPMASMMEASSTADRINALGLKLANHIERSHGYYALMVPAGVDRGRQPFVSVALAAELAGCGSKSMAGPVLNGEHGFMYYSALITTLPLPVDGPVEDPVCPAPECLDMWAAEGTTPCLATCPIGEGGCLGGRIEDGRIAETQYDRARCTTRSQTYWVPGFQKALQATLEEKDPARRRMIINSSGFTRTLWSMTYSGVSQAQCFECMRVCPAGRPKQELR